MLVNPTLRYDADIMEILTAIGQGGKEKEIEPGIFIANSFASGNWIRNAHEDYFDFGELGPYGVADNIEQVKEAYAEWLNDPELRFCVFFTKVTKAEQYESGGWRWHKWGEYIGTKNPQHEYLYDEDDSIQEVYVYHIYQLLD